MKRLGLLVLMMLLLGNTAAFAQTAAQYVGAGNQSYAAKDYVKGAQYYQAAVQLDPNSAAAYQGLGNCQYMLGKNAEALAAYEKASSLDPNNTQLSSFVQTLKAKVGSAPAAPAASPASSSPSSTAGSGGFELAPFGGIGYSTDSGYGLGFGGGLSGYFGGGGDLSFGGTVAYYTFSGPSASYSGGSISSSFSNIEVLAALKYHVGTGSMRPYLVAGGGLSLLSVTSTVTVTGFGTVSGSASTTNPMVQAGGGLEFSAGKGMNVFVEAKGSIIIGSGGTSTYIPASIGLDFNL